MGNLKGNEMLKSNTFKLCFLIPVIIFCLNLKGFSFDQCVPPDCPSDISTIPQTVEFTADWLLEWDPNNPQQINRNSSVTVNVINGVPPYSWSVSGSGFSLDDNITEGLSNTLLADYAACGSAEITVTDSRNATATGSVRCSAGQWVQVTDDCQIPGPANNGNYERIEGQYRVYQRYTTNGATSSSACQDDEDGTFTCDNAGSLGSCYTRFESCDGGSGMGCVECISHGVFPCVQQEPCGDGTYKTVRCYCTSAFTLYEWQCQ
jgi:hypothetical protein